ncbi:DUF2585 family protein [Mangrovibrevibacter kandeliae]|uniref:DUF2585 family protein n=1 Tax=Mangrovibrevibacter kandeliae TaxID=2968473 RepID=UPI00223088DC|nr:DUF2585 family protein [Aurantimonas sp. MSK8Z-1]
MPERLAAQLVLAAGLLIVMMLGLRAIGRPWTCPCGTLRLWQPDPLQSSQQLADWYSLLHVSFGLGVCAVLHRFAPRWPFGAAVLTALASSAVWEIVENLPLVIRLFVPPGGVPPYGGDTVLNSLGDTAFVIVGTLLGARLRTTGVLLLVLLIDLTVSLAIDDGILLGGLRLIGLRI